MSPWLFAVLSHPLLGDLYQGLTTGRGSGGSSRVTPVAPDASLLGAIDAHWVAPHLDKIDGSRLEACQPT
ncbi:unnamed protein product [Pleuronectes platessa]|uniref:Uncharacterized protein n=1 Tax=Pleuronectes platessa TaxID=8262 RepID=A0A9N7VMK4_PLEPL|nr:unnamed protein product [Pleuronectes platessa]